MIQQFSGNGRTITKVNLIIEKSERDMEKSDFSSSLSPSILQKRVRVLRVLNLDDRQVKNRTKGINFWLVQKKKQVTGNQFL